MRTKIWTIMISVMLLTGLARTAHAEQFNKAQRQELEGIIKTYLLSHPEIVREMNQKLEENDKIAEEVQRKGALTAGAEEIFHGKGDYVAGNAKGKLTMVEFFDYNCGWCKKGFPEVYSLMDEDKDLKVVLKEFPIFGEDSEYAARAALAANNQGKYWPLHIAMFSYEGKITKSVVDQLVTTQGLDLAKLKADMFAPAITDTLLRTRALAQTLAINGTPAFIIDDKLIPGYLPRAELAATIAEVRAKGGCALC